MGVREKLADNLLQRISEITHHQIDVLHSLSDPPLSEWAARHPFAGVRILMVWQLLCGWEIRLSGYLQRTYVRALLRVTFDR